MFNLQIHKHRGLHGHSHIDRQRLVSIWMFRTAIVQTILWTILIVLSLMGVQFFVHLFSEVFWVSILSLYANWATVISIVAGSWAALAAGDSHHDAEAARKEIQMDMKSIEQDIGHLAELEPGKPAEELANQISKRLRGE